MKAGGYGGFFRSKFFFSDNTRVRIFIFFVAQSAIFFPEFNIMLYDKNSESDYFFFLHLNQNICSATLGMGIRIYFWKKTHRKLNGPSLSKVILILSINNFIQFFQFIGYFIKYLKSVSCWYWWNWWPSLFKLSFHNNQPISLLERLYYFTRKITLFH